MRRLLLALLLVPVFIQGQAPAYDLILRGGRIVDGTASPWYRADIAIKGDTIVRIAPSIAEPATRVIDVKGLVVAPGFIDIHTHARRGIFEVPTADNYVRQGVTTLDRRPGWRLADSARAVSRRRSRRRASRRTSRSFVGQGSIRSEVMGEVDRAGDARRAREDARAGAAGHGATAPSV